MTEQFAKRIADLSPEQLAYFKTKVQQKGLDLAKFPLIPKRRPDGEVYPSFEQEQMWVFNQLEPDSVLHTINVTYRSSRPLEMAHLERSINEIIHRHEILRTTFVALDGQVRQLIAPSLKLPITVVDLREASEQKQLLQHLAEEEIRQAFDLVHGPLMRALVVQLGNENILFVTMHHIITDWWSFHVFNQELSILYHAFSTKKTPSLPELPIQFADYANWQREEFHKERFATQLHYWKKQLRNIPDLLMLPTDFPRPPIRTFKGARVYFQFPHDLLISLKSLCQQEQVTHFMALLSAFIILLHRYTQQNDIVVGSPNANRHHPGTKELIGLFMNIMVLRAKLHNEATVREVLAHIKEVALNAYAHQDIPFGKLVEELQPKRNLSRNPLFQVMFLFLPRPETVTDTAAFRGEPVVQNENEEFDLSIALGEGTQDFGGYIQYSTDLFEHATIQRMVTHLQNILEAMTTHPEQSIAYLPLLTEDELHQQIIVQNSTQSSNDTAFCVHQLFEAQAARTPDTIAVISDDSAITYEALNLKSQRLATYLQSLGVTAEVRVGICLERSLEMMVGLLGILKAGGTYVPLDPTLPETRLTFMMDDAQVAVVLTQRSRTLPEHGGTRVNLDEIWKWDTQKSQALKNANPLQVTTMAYIIYTSGSTGKPKGVAIEHRSLRNYTQAAGEEYHVQPGDRVLQFSSINFDTSIEEIYPCLVRGATLVLLTPLMLTSFSGFLQTCQETALTILDLPTAYWYALISRSSSNDILGLKSVRLLIIGGEKVLPEHLSCWYKHPTQHIQLVNSYGPTETTVVATTFPLPRELASNTPLFTVPIGRAISKVVLYVLDQNLQPLPLTVPGELYIGGDNLARGYIASPALIAERFIPHPFSSEPGARLYKTGDRVCYRPDGMLEFLGRSDRQVKLRGFRIELEEIETVLGQHSDVHEAVVLSYKDDARNNQLIAYYVAKQSQPPITNELRRYLQGLLPDYMVPSTFVALEALPLTPGGKVDRHALPIPNWDRVHSDIALVEPQTQTEKLLAQIWSQVLRIKRVGIHDNFFELGGDSLLSIQIVARAKQMGIQCLPRQFFQYQTIAELAPMLSKSSPLQPEQEIITGEMPLTPIQQWMFERKPLNPHHWNQAIMLELHHPTDTTHLKIALEYVLNHHDALHLRFIPQGSTWRQFHTIMTKNINFSIVDVSKLSPSEQLLTLETTVATSQTSLHLTNGPLACAVFFDFGPHTSARLLLIIHHLVVDTLSGHILLEDLQSAYQQFALGKSVSLPPKTTSYKQWALLLEEQAQQPSIQQEIKYWLSLSQKPIPLLPLKMPEMPDTTISEKNITVIFTAAETKNLLYLVPRIYHSQIHDVLLTALAQAFASWTGEDSLLLDLNSHGREEEFFGDVDLSRSVGMFPTLFPIRLDLEKNDNSALALESIKEQLQGVPRQGIGYGILRYLSKNSEIVEAFKALPQPRVSFSYMGQLDQTFSTSTWFKLAQESVGSSRGVLAHPTYYIDIHAYILDDQLRLNWVYLEALFADTALERLTQAFQFALRRLIAG